MTTHNRPHCDALEWNKSDDDYVACSVSGAVSAVRLEGLMLAVTVNLCWAHLRYFAAKPPKWGMLKITDAITGKKIEFWQGKRVNQ